MQQFLILSSWQLVLSILLQSNLNYPHSLGLDDIVQIIENMNISKEQKLIKLSKQHLIMKQNILKSFWKNDLWTEYASWVLTFSVSLNSMPL